MARSGLAVLLACAVLILATANAAPWKPKKVKCHNKKEYPTCIHSMYCPASCPRSCRMDCQLCRPVCSCDKGGSVCQDPRFVGGDGITFYFHGRKDRDFCLLSDSNLHINGHFIGKRGPNMTRDFTWVQSIAVLFDDHRLYVGAQKTATWDDAVDRLAVTFDDEPIYLPTEEGARWQSSVVPVVSIVRSSGTNAVTVDVEGMFKITANVVPITEEESRVHRYGVTADDCFAHLDLGFKFYSLTNDVHGVLGQTYREGYVSRVKISSNMPIMGGEDKFSTSDLHAADCKVARFGRGDAGIALVTDPADVKCSSGITGRGIVCKK
ncbi:putative Root cap [Cocos nucifera]|uniref:Putative Root cap n=1 Tax=Cocos nucifera TaxID=13894 RepID=A0A8K0IWK6_COCNU|nr:putative Root cap [Cocos nucifera]